MSPSKPSIFTTIDQPSERQIRQGMRINIVAGSLGMVFVAAALGMPLTMLMEALGASGVLIGLLGTVQQVAMAVQIPASLFAERLAARKKFWAIVALIHRALWIVPPLFLLCWPTHPALVSWSILIVVAVSSAFAQASASSWWSWMADLIPEKSAGRFWGRRQSLVTVTFLLAMAVSGWLLDIFPDPKHSGGSYLGFILLFTGAAVFGCGDILLHLLVPEPTTKPLSAAPFWQRVAVAPGTLAGARLQAELRSWLTALVRACRNLAGRVLSPLRDANFRWLTLSMGAWYWSVGVVGAFGIIYLKRDFGATYTQLSVINITASLGTIVASLGWGYVMDRIGARAFGAIMIIISPFCGLVWFFVNPSAVHINLGDLGLYVIPQAIVLLFFVNMLAGALYCGVGLCQASLISALAPREGKTMAMAVHWTVVGLMGALGPVCGGWLMDHLSVFHAATTFAAGRLPEPEHGQLVHYLLRVLAAPQGTEMPAGGTYSWFQTLWCIHFLSSWLIAMPLLLKVRAKAAEPNVREAIDHLVAFNPLRIFSNIYSIYAVGAAVPRATRAKAVRKLGESRTTLAVTDLIERLDDPAADVREAAISALGAIGSPAAVDALIAKLEDPHSDMAPQIARALRMCRDPRSVDALVKRLPDADRETQTEVVRALGAIGDRRAASNLLELIDHTHDAKVISATSDALANLGELAAIYHVLPHMKATANPVLRRSLAVAVGDLLGEPEGFYKVLNLEQESKGSEVDRQIGDLQKALRRGVPKAQQKRADELSRCLDELRDSYERNDIKRCATLLFVIACGFAELLHGVQYAGHDKAFVCDLVWRDQRFGVGVWFLALFHSSWADAGLGDRDLTDVLLGIYFLSSQQDRLAKLRDAASDAATRTPAAQDDAPATDGDAQ